MKPTGLLKHRVDVYRLVSSIDSGGSPIETFSFLKKIKSNIQPHDSKEDRIAGRPWSNNMLKIYIKDTEDILMSDRIFYNNEFYDITEAPIWLNSWQKLILSRTK